MKLSDLLAGCDADLTDVSNIAVTGLALDSRAVVKGNLFIALAGAKQHGLSHAQQAITNGACAIIYQPTATSLISADIPMLAIDNLSALLGTIAARFYGNPSAHMAVIGITGTNGKTSCSQFLSQLLNDCGIIGTLGWGEWGNLHKTLNTTPDALAVQHILSELQKTGKKTVAMEVSSHGLEQGRVNGVQFKGAVFTNISRDHLDYHGTMQAYLQAKLALLQTANLAFAVVNLDDAYSEQIIAATPESVKIYGVTHTKKSVIARVDELISADNIINTLNGIEFNVCWRGETQAITLPLYGDFNVENVLCVLAVLLALGGSLARAAAKIAVLQPVTGRMERFGGSDKPLVFVDYAHTPDALHKVLNSVRKHGTQTLWLVFGCGGNRDTGKRAEMGACAVQWADKVIITDDNPRFENPADIIQHILSGCARATNKVEVIQNRAHAIQHAIHQAIAGDCVVIAGKGHEDYQEINALKLPFSDRVFVLQALNERI